MVGVKNHSLFMSEARHQSQVVLDQLLRHSLERILFPTMWVRVLDKVDFSITALSKHYLSFLKVGKLNVGRLLSAAHDCRFKYLHVLNQGAGAVRLPIVCFVWVAEGCRSIA